MWLWTLGCWDCPGLSHRPKLIAWVCKSRELYPARGERNETWGGAFKAWELLNLLLLALKMNEGGHEPRNVGSPQKLGIALIWHLARRWDLSPTTSRGWIVPTPQQPGSGFSPRVFRKEGSLVTPWFYSSEICVGLPSYKTER